VIYCTTEHGGNLELCRTHAECYPRDIGSPMRRSDVLRPALHCSYRNPRLTAYRCRNQSVITIRSVTYLPKPQARHFFHYYEKLYGFDSFCITAPSFFSRITSMYEVVAGLAYVSCYYSLQAETPCQLQSVPSKDT
jgi:hypothetical protein